MLATPSGGEFNRFDRDGDYVEGNIQIIEISDPKGAFLEFLTAEYGVLAGGLRQNGNDLEFYDTTHGVWMKLSTLTGHLGDIHYVVPAAGQTVFNLPFSYVVGSNTLSVHQALSGKVPGPGAPTPVYVETNPTTVTFNAVAPWTPFVGGGTELVIFYVAGRPIVNDTYLVKGDAADANPQSLDVKITGSGAAVATSPGSPANTLRDINVPFATVPPPASAGAGAVGASTKVAKEDHQHPTPAQDPPLAGAIPPADGGAGAVGISGNAARQDHQHPGNYYYDEATNGAGFVAGVGPNHVVTVGTAYPTGVNALMPFHNGVLLPLSRITELTALTYRINGLGLLNATDVIATRLAG